MDKELSNASQQALGYKRSELGSPDHTLDDAHLETRCPLDNVRHTTLPQHAARQPVGDLELLPLELVNQILLALDVPTLTGFRRVNRRAMELVNSLHEYRVILKHCPSILRAIVSIRASYVACRALYNTLFTTKCSSCDRFGGYLYLITCVRVCRFCFIYYVDYSPISEWEAINLTGGWRRVLKLLPHVYSLPGAYGYGAESFKDRILLFDRRAVCLLIKGRGTGQPEPAANTIWEPQRFMSIISAPYLTHAGQKAEWGLHCRLCKGENNVEDCLTAQFTKDELIAHIQQHRETGDVWNPEPISGE